MQPTPRTHRTDQTKPLNAQSIGKACVKVIGLGGGGSNAVNRMIELGLPGVDFIAANTDRQALASSLAPVQVQLGPKVTRGLGAGGDPSVGAAAAMESSRELADALRGADMVFVTAGMGGGTGTGAASVAAEIARELGAVVIAVVTKPFTFEMSHRAKNAEIGIQALRPQVNTLITVPNDRLLEIVPRELSLEVAFRLADDVLRQGVQGIAELITRPGLINVDFAHVRQLMLLGGGAFMSIGLGEGEEKAQNAIKQALHHPLLEADSLENARGVLVHFTGGEDLTLFEVGESMTMLRNKLPMQAELVLGATTEPAMSDRAQVILIVTGIGAETNPVPHAKVPVNASRRPSTRPIDVNSDDLDLPTFLRKRVAIGS